MENRPNASIHDLFSRGSSPPPHTISPPQQQQAQQQQQQSQQQQSQQQAQQPSQPAYLSHNVSSSNQIESLFQNLSSASPSDHHHNLSSSQSVADDYSHINSAPTTPVMSISDDPVTPPAPSTSSVSDSRQSALLSLLGGPSSAPSQPPPAAVPVGPQQQAQQIPTPPGSSQRSGASPSHNEAQGKFLLEQLMAGNPPRSNYSESQRGSSLPGSAPTPPYSSTQHESEYRPFPQHDPAIESSQTSQPPMQSSYPPPQSQPAPSQQQQQQQQPPSPRKTMFDFVSPFDALSSTSSVKKKPAPNVSSGTSGTEDSGSWTAVTDPKRQSVDNLLESLARAQLPPPPVQTSHPSYDPYFGAGGEYTLGDQSRVPPPPLPPKPAGVPARNGSPRASPPKTQAQRARLESPSSQHNQPTGVPSNNASRRDKESSPGPGTRGSLRAKNGRNNKNVNSPSSPQAQNIVFDVSQPLDEIQAPRDAVKSTAIALVKQDTVFLPGTTIGATTWVAYAMTKGRIRVISRSSGDRTLLQLPAVFPPSTSVTDMAVYGNRLAGVTSDGGFVVWELPDIITDDVPGQLLLCVGPTGNHEPLNLVKWHPKEPDTLAVASESQIFLLDLGHAHLTRGRVLVQSDLHEIGQVFTLSSPLVAFDFDVIHYTLASISVDSTLTIWNVHDQVPYSTHKVRGDDVPSSLTFVDGGIIVGRRCGTIYQLLSMTTKSVLSTVKFVNGAHDDPDMFGHSIYDGRIQTLWVANSRRDSMIALRINLESSVANGEEAIRGYFEQVVEFSGLKPTIHFVILTEYADPNGDESYAACIAAKVPPGELALVAFSVHSSGVDQILIRKEWFDSAMNTAQTKFPPYTSLHHMAAQVTNAPTVYEAQPTTSAKNPRGQNAGPSQPTVASAAAVHPPRMRTPPSEEIEGDVTRDEGRAEPKGKGGKVGKVKFGGEDRGDKGNNSNKSGDTGNINEATLGQAITREIRKTEENLHNRISKMFGKEMDKQHQRMEEARAHEQAEDFARQEKILKLISNELTKNTTRVVEMAVKSEVQNSVLPSLEAITRNEVKAALHDQVGTGLVDIISQNLPVEIEKLLLRPDISSHFSHLLSTNLAPLIDRHIKEAVSKTLLPYNSQQTTAMHQELIRELRNEIHSVKTELNGWQNEALRSQENSIRELERSVRTLTDQVKFLTLSHSTSSTGPLHHIQTAPQQHGSPSGSNVGSSMNQSHLRQPNVSSSLPSTTSNNFPVSHGNFPPPQAPPPPQQITSQWFSANIAAPQASHPATIPQPPTQTERTPPIKPEQWDEIYLGVLHTQDANKLRDLLAHTNPELIMPLSGQVLVSQAVILTLVHRLSALVGELSPTDDSLKTSLWWLQRAVVLLRPEDKLITDFIPRVIPNVQVLLNTTKQRLAIPIPGGPPTLDIARTISDVQESLRRKVMPVA